LYDKQLSPHNKKSVLQNAHKTHLVLLLEWRRWLFRWVWLRDRRDLELCSLRADFTDSVSIPVWVWYPCSPGGMVQKFCQPTWGTNTTIVYTRHSTITQYHDVSARSWNYAQHN